MADSSKTTRQMLNCVINMIPKNLDAPVLLQLVDAFSNTLRKKDKKDRETNKYCIVFLFLLNRLKSMAVGVVR